MNKFVRNSLKNTFDNIVYFFSNLTYSLVSLARIIVLTSFKVAYGSNNYKRLKLHDVCCVLGNGPSLKKALDQGSVRVEGSDLFVVNFFCQSDYFWKLKPRFYFVIDDALFDPRTARAHELVEILTQLLNKVDWDIYLMISSNAVSGGVLRKISNDHIRIIRFNTTEIDGFVWFRHLLYKMHIGMPRCQTVLNFALSAGISMRYDKIFLYGADHTWTRDLFVDDDNVVCYGDRHVYNTNLQIVKHERNMAEILSDFSNMFEAHMKIRKYSDVSNVKIINLTEGSFVDAYERREE